MDLALCFVSGFVGSAILFFHEYGWFIVIGLVCLSALAYRIKTSRLWQCLVVLAALVGVFCIVPLPAGS